MRTSSTLPLKPRPLNFSLARLSSAAAVVATLLAAGSASHAATAWDGNAPGTGIPGDGFLWTNPNNWAGDSLPISDDVTFGTPGATVGTIVLNGNQSALSLEFTDSYTLGAYGTKDVITDLSGNVSVATGKFVTMNAAYGGTSGLNLSGGGSLFLNNPLPTFGGNINVDGPGTTLIFKSDWVAPQYSGVNGTQLLARNDYFQLGFTTVTRTTFLTNGAEFKLLGGGSNPDSGQKNLTVGFGGGAVNIAAGYTQWNLDDTGQLSVNPGETFTLRGKGRLTIAGTMATTNPLAGPVIIDGGILEFSSVTAPRFNGMTAFNTLTVNNGGVLFLNNGTAASAFDSNVVATNGSVFAIGGSDVGIGALAGGNTMDISGTVTFLSRDLLNPQTQRAPRINADLTGSGTLLILPSTASGSTPRTVIQRSVASTFNGVFKVVENASLELNPRANVVVDTGKVMANGDLEFAGWGGTLDLRDSNAAAAAQFDYFANDISVTTTQPGALNVISVTRATAGTGTGHQFAFGTLSIGTQRLGFAGNNGYSVGFANTVNMTGDATFEMRSAPLTLLNGAALSENAAGRTLKLLKSGLGNAGAADVTSGGAISVTNLNVDSGTLALRGAAGAVTTGFGGSVPIITVNGGTTGSTSGPTFGTLNLDSNGAILGIPAANNNNRIIDSAILNMRGNSVLRLTSLNNTQTTETIGTTNVSGHALFDVAKTGTAPAPVALTLSSLNMTGVLPTANFTGTSLGVAGTNTSRIVIPGTPTGTMGAQFHSGNEWAKYSNSLDNGFELGVTPFVPVDYTSNTGEGTWVAGQQVKYTIGGTFLTGSRTIDRINLALPANQSINLNGNVLTLAQGGILVSTNTTAFLDTNATFPTPAGSLTAGTTVASAQLYVHANAQLDIKVPIANNLAGGSVDFVKSGTSTVRLTHQSLGIGAGAGANTPFIAPTWSSTMTGSWVVNDGVLEVQRGQFLNSRPIVLNGGTLFVNEPVQIANSGTILPNWGNNVTVNGNASFVLDDNGESTDINVGGNALLSMGSLTINNGSTLSYGSYGNGQQPVINLGLTGAEDTYFPGGTTISGGKATFNLGVARSGTTGSLILGGAVTGNGFEVVAYGPTPSTLELGAGAIDGVANNYTDVPIVYGGILRLNKLNGTNTILDLAASEDLVINGGTVAWGSGDHGDLVTNNNVNAFNIGIAGGIAPTSPIGVQNAGKNQIADGATVTLLSGTLGDGDRFNTDKWATLIQKNGTFNVGLGTIEVDLANISGGAFNIDRGGAFKAGTLNLLPGAPNLNITTGIAAPGLVTTLDIGAGGLSITGQNIVLGSGSSGNVAGSGAVLRLGGNVTVTGTNLIGNSYYNGIYIQTGSSFREIGASKVDLTGGVRDFNIATDNLYFITAPITNGGLTKSGGGALNLEPYQPSTFTGAVVVNNGVVAARADGAFGTSAGGVIINSGGTVKLESGWTYGDAFTISGPGALVPGDANVREIGALISDTGTNRITGAVTIAGGATIASNIVDDPSFTPATGGNTVRTSNLLIESAGGITGTGNLVLSGNADGVVFNGINTSAGGLTKDGAGRWAVAGASSYTGATTISAGTLRITNGGALGSAAVGTTVLGGSLELANGISLAEPLNLNGLGASSLSGAVLNVSGVNTLTGAISLGSNTTLRSDAGTLALAAGANITGSGAALTLSGAGAGSIAGNINLGSVITTDAITKNGTGTWTLTGSNTSSGSTRVNGGLLSLASAGTLLDSGSPLNLGGGSITNVGPAAQVADGLNLLAGGGSVTGQSLLSVGVINRTIGATATFSGNVIAPGTPNDATGIIGAYATVGSDWARVNGSSQVVAFNSYVDLATAGVTSNASRSAYNLLTGSATVNTLKISGGTGADLGVNNLTLTGGGLMYTGSLNGGINGSGLISGATAFDELIVNVSGTGTLDIAAPLIGGSGGLTKTGNGKLVLSGNSSYSGPININAGTLSIVGPGGTTHPAALGSASGPRNINVNGGTFESVGGDYNPGATNMYFVIGSAGGTIRSSLGANITLDDGGGAAPGQLSGSGDLTFTGGGRYGLGTGGTPNYPNFTGKITVDGGILLLGNGAATGALPAGGRAEQTITLKAGSAIVNNTPYALGLNGLQNNLVLEGGAELYAGTANRVYSGNVQLFGTNTIGLMDRDNVVAERQQYFNGRVSGTGVTLNVYGVVNNTPMYLTSGSNDLTGTINLFQSAVLEARTPGSLGVANGDVTVNLAGANSRLLLRNYQNGDYHANVIASDHVEINVDRLANYAGGGSQLLTINNLTVAGGEKILTFNGANGFAARVGGTVTYNGDAIINTVNVNALFENGINFAGGTTLDKRGSGVSLILRGPSNNTGATIIQQGFLVLQGGGTLLNTSDIQLRGGELRLDNSETAIGNRLNDAATVTLGGGVLRITGPETLGTVTAVAGTTQVVYNPASETVASALTLTGFTRQTGAVVQFQSPDLGPTTIGATTIGNSRVSSRILIPGQADVTGTADVIPGMFGNNNVDFIQYDGTTIDNGAPLGVRDSRNPGSNPLTFAVPYINDAAETAWTDATVLRLTTSPTLTAGRSLDALKIEAAVTLTMAANNLRIESGGILAATTATPTITGTTGRLYAGKAVPTAGTAELFIGGNVALNINSIISDNPLSGQNTALVKTGTNQVNLGGASANTYTGGTYITSGILNLTVGNALGAAANPIFMTGGTLQLNVPSATSAVTLGGLGQPVTVGANSTLILDNGTGVGINNTVAFGRLAIPGPYTFSVRGFDAMDVKFSGLHNFVGTPTIDLAQVASGSNPNTAGAETFLILDGEISGSGFYVNSFGSADNTQARLQIGGGATDFASNSYNGKVTIVQGNFTEDTFVELNKAAGVTAINGDLELDGGTVLYRFDNQIVDSSNIVNNRGILNFNGKSETIASVVMRGGGMITNPTTAVQPFNTINITGDLEVTGFDDFGGVTTGFTVGNNSTVTVGGQIRIGTFGRIHLSEGQTAGILNVNGGLQMTGALLSQNNGAGANIVRLNSDVETFAATVTSNLGNSSDSDTFLELNGTRTFTVADGSAGIDLSLSTVIRNSTSPAAVGGLVKNGNGVVQIQGGGTSNSYTGPTVINSGAVMLFKNVGVNTLGNGSATNTLTIGDGIGGSKADQVIVRNSSQIADGTAVTIASSGLLDLETFNTSEVIGDLSGTPGASITVGPNSILTVTSAASTTYSGNISGDGTLTKAGSGTLYLDGSTQLNVATINANAGTLNIDSNANNAVFNANNAGTNVTFGVSQELTSLNIGDGAVVTLGDLPGPPAPAEAFGFDAGSFAAGGQTIETAQVGAVPEPGAASLLMLGVLSLLGRRRATKR